MARKKTDTSLLSEVFSDAIKSAGPAFKAAAASIASVQTREPYAQRRAKRQREHEQRVKSINEQWGD
jgi:hypothetical protein